MKVTEEEINIIYKGRCNKKLRKQKIIIIQNNY